jgi:hypothetical protein
MFVGMLLSQLVSLHQGFAVGNKAVASSNICLENPTTCAGVTVVMTVKLDYFPEEFFYRLYNDGATQILYQSLPGEYENELNAEKNIEFCLERGKTYVLILYDTAGNGFCFYDGYVVLDYDKADSSSPSETIISDSREYCPLRYQLDHYFSIPTLPTCTDGIQNGDETGVDCGGACNGCAAPNWTGLSLPQNITVSFQEAPNLNIQSLAYNNGETGTCELSGTIAPQIVNLYDSCGGSIGVTWEYPFDCGNSTLRHSQTITVSPTSQASWISPPADDTLSPTEADNFTFSNLSYSNGLSGTGQISGSVSGVKTGSYDECGGTLYVDWSFTDDCNRTITHKQTITVNPATQASWISPPADLTLSPTEADNFTFSNLSYTNSQTGTGEISGSASGTKTGSYDECGGTLYVDWSFTDDCNRTITHKQTITVSPAIQASWISPPADVTLSPTEADNFTFSNLSYTNSQTGTGEISGSASGTKTGSYDECGGTLYVDWSFTDDCNRTITHKQTITVSPATQASWVSPPADLTLSPEQADTFTVSNLLYDNAQTGTGEISGSAPGTKTGSYDECGGTLYVDWSFTDACNRTISHRQTITVTPSNPIVWINPPVNQTLTVAQADGFRVDSLSYTNNGTGSGLLSGKVAGTRSGAYTSCGGTLSVNWSFTDPCGRPLTHTQTITVVPAPQAQFVNAPSNQTLSLTQANSYSAPALVCTNGMSGNGNITATVAASVQRNYSACGGNMLVRWSYTDGCGRTTRYEQTITVQAVLQGVFLNPPGNITITCPAYQNYTSPVLLLSNNQSGNNLISGAVAAQVTAGPEVCGSGFTETWSYTDVCGRTTTHSRLVTVTATCDDGIQNQGEEDIDCGGPCKSCATCDDGIKNQDEAGIDCGGPCSPCPVCLEPINQQSVRTGTNRVALSWEGVANVTKYVLQIRVAGSDKWFVFETTSTSLTIRGLSSDTDYEWQVYSDCEVIESPWSALCSFNASDEEPISCSDSVRPPSCEDGILNQGEEETDCGGPCTACLHCDVPDNLFADGINADSARLQWSAIPDAGSYRVRVKMRDSLDWRTYSTANTYLVISDLIPDVEYDWQVKSDCSAKESDWSEACGFIANDPASGDCAAEEAPDPTCFDGKQNQGEAGIDCGGPCYLCPGCYVPTGLYVDNIANRRATLNWSGTEWDSVFQVWIRELGSETWYSFRTENTSLTIRGLSRATDYEWQVQSGCGALGESGWSDACSFNSDEPNSGSCGGSEQPEETLCEVSSPENLYAEIFTDQTVILHWDTVAHAEWYTLRVKRSETEWEEYETMQNNYLIEALLSNAAYEWQVSAACIESVSEWSSSCGFIANDEESGDCAQEAAPSCEDGLQNQGEEGIDCGGPCEACVSEDNCPAPGDLGAEIRQIGRIYLVSLVWSASEALEYELRVRAVGTSTWTTYQLARLPADQVYEWQLRSICGEEAGSWSAESTFTLGNPSLSGLVPGSGQATGISIYPNPLNDRTMLLLERPLEKAERVRLLNVFGQEVWAAVLSEGQSRHEFDLSEVPAGLYLLDVDQNEVLKIVIQ